MSPIPTPRVVVGGVVVFRTWEGDVLQGVVTAGRYQTVRREDSVTPEILGWVYEVEVKRESGVRLYVGIDEVNILESLLSKAVVDGVTQDDVSTN